MKRRLITSGLVLSIALTAVGAPKFGSAQSATTWPTFHGSAARDGVSSGKGPTTSTATDQFQLPKAVESSPVVDAQGTAYVGDDDGNVYALNSTFAHQQGHFGAPKWSFATGGAVIATPTLSSDGKTLYVGSSDGKYYAINTADGSKIWSADAGGPVYGSPVLSPDGGTLYDATITGTLKALKTSDGSTVSTTALNGSIRGNLALSPDGSTLYAATTTAILDGIAVGSSTGSGGITAFYLDGPPAGSPAVDTNGNVYITTQVGTLLSFAASNTTLRAGYPFIVPNRSLASTTPAIINGSVLFGASNGVFYSVNASSAQVQWQVQTSSAIESSAAVASGNSAVYFGGDDTQVHAVTTAGQAMWARTVGTSVTSSPAIGPDGSVWVGSLSGAVFRFQDLAGPPPPQTVTAGPTSTPGPTSIPGPTSTPLPTATPSAPATVPLTISAKSSVNPGKKQTVKITTTAGMQVSMRVDYPNGDHQSKKVTANSSGKATYSYTQGQSKVKHNSSTATITAKAGTGASQTVKTVTYKIGFGSIDVSIEPRTVAAKHVVNLYVHTKVGKKVAASLLFPTGKFVNLGGTAGPKGWAHIRYTVPKGATRGSNHKVTVLARPKNNLKISTKSTFTIK